MVQNKLIISSNNPCSCVNRFFMNEMNYLWFVLRRVNNLFIQSALSLIQIWLVHEFTNDYSKITNKMQK